jgi:hypothetical protein
MTELAEVLRAIQDVARREAAGIASVAKTEA